MKIIFSDNTLWGLINFRGDIIKHFVNRGAEVVLVAPEKEDKQMRTELPEGVRYLSVEMGRASKSPLKNIKYFFNIISIYHKERPDYIFHYTIKPNVYGTLAAHLFKIPNTAMMPGLGYVFTNNNLTARIARLLYKHSLQFTSHLFLLNRSNFELVLQKKIVSPSKIVLLEHGEGVNLERFRFFDNTSESVIFTFIGRVLWEKGYDEFSQAARIVKQKYPTIQFEVWGALDDAYPKSVSKQRVQQDEKDGVLIYKGFVSDMMKVYERKGMVVTLPSYYGEGMNRSLMEACAVGKPIITTDIAGCRELVEHGKNGYIVPVKNVNKLAEAMIKYIELSDSEKKAFSVSSRSYAEKYLDVQEICKIYDKLVK